MTGSNNDVRCLECGYISHHQGLTSGCKHCGCESTQIIELFSFPSKGTP